jgi:hypothetical protein
VRLFSIEKLIILPFFVFFMSVNKYEFEFVEDSPSFGTVNNFSFEFLKKSIGWIVFYSYERM